MKILHHNKKLLSLALFFSLGAVALANEANIKAAQRFIASFGSGDSQIAQKLLDSNYTQHNQNFKDGKETIIAAIQSLKGSKITIHRAFSDDNYVVLHSTYKWLGKEQVIFDIFAFRDGKIIAHWDNVADKTKVNPSGRSQIDGTSTINTKADSKANKKLVENFVRDVLMGQNPDKLTSYFNGNSYIQHNSAIADGLDGLGAALESMAKNNVLMRYEKIHKVLGSGDFVLVVSEGVFGKEDSKSQATKVAFYDLFRVENGKIAEHWDIIEPILESSKAQNNNGKFGF